MVTAVKVTQLKLDNWLKVVQKEEKGKILVRTSSGLLEPFNPDKIVKSLLKETAYVSEQYSDVPPLSVTEARDLAKNVKRHIQNLPFVSAPLIRELVCTLMLLKAKKDPRYAVYRNFYTRVGTPIHDYLQIIQGGGYEARENANLQPNPETVHKKIADKTAKDANMLAVLPHEIGDAHLTKRIHVHDLEYLATRPFCQNWDLRYFLYGGLLPDGTGLHTAVAGPPKHPEVALLHSVKVMAAGQTNFAGGQGLYNYPVFMAPYLRGLSYDHIKQLAQMLFYEIGQAYVARGGQLMFASLQMPPGVPSVFRDIPAVMHGKILEDTYGNYEEEVQKFVQAIFEVALGGDHWQKPFVFPKLEVLYDKEFLGKQYEDYYHLVHEVVAKYGTPYFENRIPSYRSGIGDNEVKIGCYQCCAYDQSTTDKEDPQFWDKLYFKDGAHFSWGAWQVVSLNAPQHAYLAKGDDEHLFEELEKSMRMAIRVFKIKQRWMESQMANGLLPFVTQTPRGPNGKHLPPAVDSTQLRHVIGLVGVNELVQYHTGYQLHEDDSALKFSLRFVIEMERIKEMLQKESGLLLACARTPAESTAQRMAISDLVHFREQAMQVVKGDLSKIGENEIKGVDLPVYYSNGTHVAVNAEIPLSKKMSIEGKFFPALSGGNIFHCWLGEASPDPNALMDVTLKMFTKTPIGYMAYTKDLSVCRDCSSTISGLIDNCPVCFGQNMEWYSRITGYYQAVSGWNAGKKQELKDRYRLRTKMLLS